MKEGYNVKIIKFLIFGFLFAFIKDRPMYFNNPPSSIQERYYHYIGSPLEDSGVTFTSLGLIEGVFNGFNIIYEGIYLFFSGFLLKYVEGFSGEMSAFFWAILGLFWSFIYEFAVSAISLIVSIPLALAVVVSPLYYLGVLLGLTGAVLSIRWVFFSAWKVSGRHTEQMKTDLEEGAAQ